MEENKVLNILKQGFKMGFTRVDLRLRNYKGISYFVEVRHEDLELETRAKLIDHAIQHEHHRLLSITFL